MLSVFTSAIRSQCAVAAGFLGRKSRLQLIPSAQVQTHRKLTKQRYEYSASSGLLVTGSVRTYRPSTISVAFSPELAHNTPRSNIIGNKNSYLRNEYEGPMEEEGYPSGSGRDSICSYPQCARRAGWHDTLYRSIWRGKSKKAECGTFTSMDRRARHNEAVT